MMIYNMINLAQFERKQTSERISMNFHSRALRGLKNGGTQLLGYDKDPSNSGKLVVNEKEAVQAREIFALYLRSGSLQQSAEKLNAEGIRPKSGNGKRCRNVANGFWTVSTIRNLLTNWSYIGKREINKSQKDEDQNILKPWHRYQIVQASWPAIIEESVFLSAQRMVEENWKKERSRIAKGERRFFLLSGVIRCGDCSMALTGQTSHGRTSSHRYYGHKPTVSGANQCKFKRFRADDVEDAVVNHLTEILFRSGHLDKVEDNIRKSVGQNSSDLTIDRDRVLTEIAQLDSDIESAINLHSQMTSSPQVLGLIQEKLEKLAERKRRLVLNRDSILAKIDESNDAKTSRDVIEDHAKEFKRGWPKATVHTRKRLLRRLVNQLIYTRDGLHTYYVTAQDQIMVKPIPETKMASELDSGAIPKNFFRHSFPRSTPTGLLSASGVPRVYFGGNV